MSSPRYVTTAAGSVDIDAIGIDSPNPRYETLLAGWALGWESRTAEIDRLRWERDLWYFVANNKGKRPTDFYTHHTNELWNQGVAA